MTKPHSQEEGGVRDSRALSSDQRIWNPNDISGDHNTQLSNYKNDQIARITIITICYNYQYGKSSPYKSISIGYPYDCIETINIEYR